MQEAVGFVEKFSLLLFKRPSKFDAICKTGVWINSLSVYTIPVEYADIKDIYLEKLPIDAEIRSLPIDGGLIYIVVKVVLD